MFLVEKVHLSSNFRSFTKKPSPLPKSYQLAARSFDEKLVLNLKTLSPVSDSSTISLSWLSDAVRFLSSVHSQAQDLISENLRSEADDSQALYMDYSLKVLDLCNLISSAVRQLTDRRLLMNLGLRLLDFSGQIPAPEKLNKAKDVLSRSVDNKQESSEEKGIRAVALIGELAAALGSMPRGKTSSARDLIRRTFYALGALTLFVAGVLVSVLYGRDDVVKVRVPAEFVWADSVNAVQDHIFDLIIKQEKKGWCLAELDETANKAAVVRDVVDGVVLEGEVKDRVRLDNGVKELETAAKKFSNGIEGLTNGVDGLFSTVLKTRNGVMDSVRKGQL